MNDHASTMLRSLDPAPAGTLDDVARRRSAARLQQILTTDPAPRLSGTRSRTWRYVLPLAAAAAVAAVVVTSTVTPSDAAYASWTPSPSGVTITERSLAIDACRTATHRADASPVLVERRGDWIGVALSTTEPAYATCVVELPRGAARTGAVTAAVSGGQGAVPTAGQFTDGAISTSGGPGFLGIGSAPTTSFNLGNVGPNITRVRINTPNGRDVEATVKDGHYFAWWPGTAFGTKKEGNGAPAPALTYRLTLNDGTVLQNAQPVLPD